jgi:hypothetical protein
VLEYKDPPPKAELYEPVNETDAKAFVPVLVFPVCAFILNEIVNAKSVNSFFIVYVFKLKNPSNFKPYATKRSKE